MKYLALLLLVMPSIGCVGAGTKVDYDPETHAFAFERSWLGGPFYITAEATLPDGTELSVHCESDNNLETAGKARAGDQATIQALAALVSTLAAQAAPTP